MLSIKGTIYVTKTSRVFFLYESTLPKKKGVYKFYYYEELNDINNMTVKSDGICGRADTKGAALKALEKKLADNI